MTNCLKEKIICYGTLNLVTGNKYQIDQIKSNLFTRAGQKVMGHLDM